MRMTRSKRCRVQLNANFPDEVAVIRAGLAGAGLYYVAVRLNAFHRDGVPLAVLREFDDVPDELIRRCVDLGLLRWNDDRSGVHAVQSDRLGRWQLLGHRPHIPLSIRRAVMERDEHRCQECGAMESLSLDHIVPFSRGGTDSRDNLRVLCRPCNSRKGARV